GGSLAAAYIYKRRVGQDDSRRGALVDSYDTLAACYICLLKAGGTLLYGIEIGRIRRRYLFTEYDLTVAGRILYGKEDDSIHFSGRGPVQRITSWQFGGI